MKNIKISFEIGESSSGAEAIRNGAKILEIGTDKGEMHCDVAYDYCDIPLRLFAKVKKGDKIECVLMSHRIELYVNGRLADEEWPAGNRLFDLGDKTDGTLKLDVKEYSEEEKAEPSITSVFEMGEKWFPGNGVFVGDCMPYRRDDEFHVLYLKDRRHHRSKWGLGAHQWAHISTKDFKVWQSHPLAVSITDASEGSICTGSWIRNGGKEYLFYTVRMLNGQPAPIRRSISNDGYHFEKDTNFGFIVSDKYNAASARDPKVLKGADGLFHMLLTTSLVKENRGCLAHYVSADLEKWEEFGAPFYISESADEPECPDYFCYNGRYYLIFSLMGRAHFMVSEKPFEDFVMPKDSVIPCGSVPKCADWNGRLIFVGFESVEGYAGYMTFKAARADEKGNLIFDRLSSEILADIDRR